MFVKNGVKGLVKATKYVSVKQPSAVGTLGKERRILPDSW